MQPRAGRTTDRAHRLRGGAERAAGRTLNPRDFPRNRRGTLRAISPRMTIKTRVTFQGIRISDDIVNHATARAEALEPLARRILRVAVTISVPHRHRLHGHPYRVRVEVATPGRTIIADRDRGDDPNIRDVFAAIDAAFEDVRRMLRDDADRTRTRRREAAMPMELQGGR